jgi:regulator of RNase E activity RraA
MIGFRILERRRAVDAALVAKFLGLPVANISDTMSRMFAGGARLRPMHDGTPMSGPAFTVRTRPGDNLGGIVVDGAIRDARALREGAFPVYAAGITHRGPYKDGPGEINVPIAIDGMTIEPGDLIVGDDDGVLCVPFDEAQALLEATLARTKMEAALVASIRDGSYDTAWIDARLRQLGCASGS